MLLLAGPRPLSPGVQAAGLRLPAQTLAPEKPPGDPPGEE